MDDPVSILTTLPTSEQIAPDMTAGAMLFWLAVVVVLVAVAWGLLMKRHPYPPGGWGLVGFAIVFTSNLAFQGFPTWVGVVLLAVGVVMISASIIWGVLRYLRSRENGWS